MVSSSTTTTAAMTISLCLYCISFFSTIGCTNASTSHIKIITLGDSFSAGNGFDYENDAGWFGPKWCFRNSNAWGQQAVDFVQSRLRLQQQSSSSSLSNWNLEYTNHACSAAKVRHITNDPLIHTEDCADDEDSVIDSDYSIEVDGFGLGGMECDHIMKPQIVNVNEEVDIVMMTMGEYDSSLVVGTVAFSRIPSLGIIPYVLLSLTNLVVIFSFLISHQVGMMPNLPKSYWRALYLQTYSHFSN